MHIGIVRAGFESSLPTRLFCQESDDPNNPYPGSDDDRNVGPIGTDDADLDTYAK